MQKLFLPFALLASIAVPCMGQGQSGNAETKGTCSPAVSGNNNQVSIRCQGISEEQAKRMTSILNKVLANQIDPDLVMGKLDEIEKLINQYIKNTTPPPGLPTMIRPPSPPEGLVGAADGNWGFAARLLAGEISEFLGSQAEPQPKPEEGVVAFVVRANAWHSAVMDQYKKQFAARVITMVKILTEKQVVDEQVADLAKDPVNPIGVRALAEQLDAGGRKYKERFGPN